MLSRIDGHTPWRLLRQIGGLPEADVDRLIAGWLESGVLVAEEPRKGASSPPPRKPVAGAEAPEAEIDESLIDPALDLDEKIQRRILEFEVRLGAPYHELLGVAKDADARAVKRAYFGLSKEFHPDRYFRREIGAYLQKLERIFKKILEAYEVLSDPKLRAELEAHDSRSEPPPAPPAAEEAPAAPRKLTKLELLKHRMPFKIPEKLMNERRDKGRELYTAAQISARRERWQEADANLRLALSFDPANTEYRSQLGEYRIKAVEERAFKILARPEEELDEKALKKAYGMLEEVAAFRPQDSAINVEAGKLALSLGMVDAALEHVDAAVALGEGIAEHHALLGRIHQRRGDRGHATRAFERALELDAENVDARKALAQLRLGRREPVHGGQG